MLDMFQLPDKSINNICLSSKRWGAAFPACFIPSLIGNHPVDVSGASSTILLGSTFTHRYVSKNKYYFMCPFKDNRKRDIS